MDPTGPSVVSCRSTLPLRMSHTNSPGMSKVDVTSCTPPGPPCTRVCKPLDYVSPPLAPQQPVTFSRTQQQQPFTSIDPTGPSVVSCRSTPMAHHSFTQVAQMQTSTYQHPSCGCTPEQLLTSMDPTGPSVVSSRSTLPLRMSHTSSPGMSEVDVTSCTPPAPQVPPVQYHQNHTAPPPPALAAISYANAPPQQAATHIHRPHRPLHC
jgi:hypothetical protein